jgi:hypothetical protein
MHIYSTFMVKVKAHRGEPLNEKADTQAENARQLPSESRTQRMTYEWSDSDGVKHVTALSKAVRNAMLRGGAESQRQKALARSVANWSKNFLNSTDIRLRSIGQAASTGAQGDLMDNERWGRRSCFNFRKQKTGTNRLPQPGQLSSCRGKVKAKNA